MSNALVSTFLGITLAVASASAQQAADASLARFARLTVRPHEMATGTENRQPGVHSLASLPGFFVYVPSSVVGAHRVPLVVLLPGGGETAQYVLQKGEYWVREISERYGMVLLVANAATNDGTWDILHGLDDGGPATVTQTAGGSVVLSGVTQNPDVHHIDAALKQVLRTYAIDPDRIAVGGMSNGGDYALFLGRSNLDVFSRVGAMSALIPLYGTGPKNPKTQFFVSGGIGEDAVGMVAQALRLTHELRQDGHAVEPVLCLRAHVDYEPDYEYLWSWLAKSWGMPGAASRFPAPAATDSDPLLTVQTLTQMTTFWTRFMREPDSILTTARLATQERILVSIGPERVSVIKANMRALAATYPSVAADLMAAGLTVQQEEAYRTAIVRVGFTRQAGPVVGGVAPASVLGQNLAFRAAHDEAFKQLAKTGMWITQ